MKKNNLDLTAVRALHTQGELDQAEKGYLAILRKNPRDISALHSLAILYAQQAKFADAVHYLQIAMEFQPNDPTLQLHLANSLKIQGDYAQAEAILKKTIQNHPDYVPALNNLGTVYYAQEKLTDAIQLFQHTLEKKPDFVDAYYNLGLAFAKQEKLTAAEKTYQTLLTLSPDHFAARFHLACILMRQDKITEALNHFIAIEATHPHHFETQSNLATCYLKKGALNEAKLHYAKALALMPDAQILFNLGVINMQQGNIDNAIQHYQQTVQLDPDSFAAHNNLGVAFLAKQHVAFALEHFKEASRLQPENAAIVYTINMLSQNKRLLAAPPDYVRSLFDAYADHYEPHLLSALDYKIPEQLFHAINTIKTMSPQSLDILDLGCGTGLCGALFKPFAKSLVGVDLSEKMLHVAAEKNIYTALHASELNTFLADKNAAYNLILAGDVLVYLGDLELLFKQISHALRAHGLFAFNTEICAEGDYRMNQSGRFSHQKNYLDPMIQKNNLTIVYYQNVMTRMQNNEPVHGHLYVLER
ncbi:MAG: tetratricopeptide repeat protein [Gammaproteobacteria bacterium]